MTVTKEKLASIHEALDKALNPDLEHRQCGVMTILFPYATPGVSFFSCNSGDRAALVTMLQHIIEHIKPSQ